MHARHLCPPFKTGSSAWRPSFRRAKPPTFVD
jgi:hypothetical protein